MILTKEIPSNKANVNQQKHIENKCTIQHKNKKHVFGPSLENALSHIIVIVSNIGVTN